MADDEVIEETEETEDEFEIIAEDDEEPEDVEPEDETEDEPEEDEREKEIQALKSDIEKLQKDNNRLGYALRHQSKEQKQEPAEAAFTDQQLVGLMREHKDDPDILFQVINQMVKQKGSEVKKEAVDSAETARVKQNLDGFLTDKFPGWDEEGTEVRGHIEKALDGFQLQDHPYGEFFAMAAHIATNLDGFVNAAVEEAKKDFIKEKAEDSRKAKIKNSKLPDGKKTTSKTAVSDDYKEVADQMGLTESQRKIYAKMRKAGSNRITVGA